MWFRQYVDKGENLCNAVKVFWDFLVLMQWQVKWKTACNLKVACQDQFGLSAFFHLSLLLSTSSLISSTWQTLDKHCLSSDQLFHHSMSGYLTWRASLSLIPWGGASKKSHSAYVLVLVLIKAIMKEVCSSIWKLFSWWWSTTKKIFHWNCYKLCSIIIFHIIIISLVCHTGHVITSHRFYSQL